MPDIARLSDTAEMDIALLSGAEWPADFPSMQTVRFPHEVTARMAWSEKAKVEQLTTVRRARVFDFNPELTPLASVSSSWLEATLDRLREIATAQSDWDGYGAPGVQPGALISAISFLRFVTTHLGARPAIVATGSGNIQFEWRETGYSIDVEIGPASEYCATLFVGSNETNEWNGNLLTGVDPDLARLIAFGWRGQTS